ncbi:MAG TPA: hypothetical protein VKY37_13335 [Brumimicrobium sp.]|nr:hypothetical protein [Brumimicrobium sp.]
MKIILLSLVTLFLLSNKEIENVRLSFHKASFNEEDAISFNKLVHQNLTIEKNLLSAYIGASEVLLAKYGASPAEKLKLFKEGKAKIEEAITTDSKNIEIRLIRLIIQNKAPSFLRYSSDIDQDKNLIIDQFQSAPADVKSFIQKIAHDTDVFTEEERTKIK